MKKNHVFLALLAGSIGLLSFNSINVTKMNKTVHLSTSGSPGGKTGAPGDGSCTSCHSGTVQSGTGFQTVVLTNAAGTMVTSYNPGETYTVSVGMLTTNAKNGFEIVALTPSNTAAGSVAVINATTTKTVTFGGKTRITQKSGGTSLNNWSFHWTAPATNVGNVTFYLGTNVTNSNGSDSGDIIRNSQHVFGSTAGIEENTAKVAINLGYAQATNSLTIDLTSQLNGEAAINLVDLSGKSVQFEQLGNVATGNNLLQVKLNKQLPKGIYVAHINVNNNFVSKKIYID
ncbi:MAG: choice-of-anchor V domain-containing protein [Moraxellaceae bacterium]|jgi:hypothetical protein